MTMTMTMMMMMMMIIINCPFMVNETVEFDTGSYSFRGGLKKRKEKKIRSIYIFENKNIYNWIIS